MNFVEAIRVIKNIIPQCSANEYDGILVKRLEASNTLDEGRTTNQTHIAISGEQMNMFPYLMADGYFNCDYSEKDEQLKKYFITQIPLYIYQDNISYLEADEKSGIIFDENKKSCVCASVVRSRRKEQADQVQLSLITSDDVDFVKFRKLLHTGDFLVILKHKERLSYDCIGIRAADENNGEYHLSVLNNKFYKLPTNTKVDIKKYIKIKDSKVENRNFTISELGNILKEMYSNAENKMQVASIHIFGIKYGKNIIQNAFKSLDIVKAAGINESYSTELQKALNIYRCLEQNSYGIYISDENAIKEEKEVLGERKTGAENILLYGVPGSGKSHEIKTKYCNDEKMMERFLLYHEKLVDIYASKKKMTMMPVKINGADFQFSAGKHNELQKAIIEEFAPRFAPNAECLYVGDTIAKDLVKNVDKLKELGFEITLHDKMPDVVLYREDKDWIYFVESVTSVGPMDPKRIIEISEMTTNVSAGKVFVTAFLDFATYKKFADSLAWETEVWIADMPDHMIHLNGDRFMGPR